MSLKELSDLLLWKRCVFMTFEQYKKSREHINQRIYYHEGFTNDVKQHVVEHIKGLADKLPFKRVPKPIYVLVARHLEYDSGDSILPANCKNMYDDLNNKVIHLGNVQNEKNASKYTKYDLTCIKNKDGWMPESEINAYTFLYSNLENANNKDTLMQSSLASYKFNGLYEVIIYVPNLNKDLQYFTSFMDFSYQNRWMNLIVSNQSKHLAVIPLQKDYEANIINLVGQETYDNNKEKFAKIISDMNKQDKDEYPLVKDLTYICYEMGCSSPYGEDLNEIVPSVSTTYDDQLSNARAKGPYYPTRCLKTGYYDKHMMKIDKNEYKKGVKENLVKNMEAFQRNYEKIKNGETPTEQSSTNLIEVIKGTATRYRNDTYKEGEGGNEYSKEYNRKIMAELAFRFNSYPGIQEITFPAFRLNDSYKGLEEHTHYMPWGNILLKDEFVLNEGDVLKVDEVSLKSFNKVYELKFDSQGVLSLFANNGKIKTIVEGSFAEYNKRSLVFENGSLNIYGYKNNNNDNRYSLYVSNANAISPLSIVIENNGGINVYDNGFNVIGMIIAGRFKELGT